MSQLPVYRVDSTFTKEPLSNTDTGGVPSYHGGKDVFFVDSRMVWGLY